MRLREIALKIGVSNHFLKIRASLRVTQQALGEEYNELLRNQHRTMTSKIWCYRFSEVTMNLAAKNMELRSLLLEKTKEEWRKISRSSREYCRAVSSV